MSYHPRIECPDRASLCTTGTRNHELWFVENHPLEEAILGHVAQCCARYSVPLYAVAIPGNHLHHLAHYPGSNRAAFNRDLNSAVAREVKRHVSSYPGGSLFARRYSQEFVPEAPDIEARFFYLVLQPVQDGRVDDIRKYQGYNCFEDAINGRVREFKVVRWAEYNEKRRWSTNVAIEDFTDTFELRFARLPGHEHRTQAEYVAYMRAQLIAYTKEAIRKRGYSIHENRAATIPGSLPRNPKTSNRFSFRPRVLCINTEQRRIHLNWYFGMYARYKEASLRFRAGDITVAFPPGMYRPPLFTSVG